jgi:hypothetical protein
VSTSYLWYLGWLVVTAVAATALALAGVKPVLGEPVVFLLIVFSPALGLGAVIGLGVVRFVERSYHLRPVAAGSVAYAATVIGVSGVITWFCRLQ